MKAAAAVLGASLLFFLGVLTGAGRRESIPPPAAIPLGVVDESASDGTGSRSPAPDGRQPTATTPTTSTAGPAPAPAGPSSPSDPSTPAGTPGAPGPPGSAGTTATTAPTAVATTSTTARPGAVEEVDSEVDCSRGNGKAKGGREPCPTTTTAARDGDRSGGGNNR